MTDRARPSDRDGRRSSITEEDLELYMHHLERSDLAGAVDQVRGLVAAGVPVRDVVGDLLAPAQSEVGRRWQCNDWSIADEHAASAVTDAAIASILLDAEEGARGSALVVCAEDEWHVLPARMLTTVLRTAGVEVIFLGGSTPSDHLRRYLERERPTAVVLSVTVPMHLPGAVLSVRGAHEAGVPVVVGGAGLGTTPHRAERIGADAWASTAEEAAAVVARWEADPPELAAPVSIPPEVVRLADERHDLVVSTMLALIEHIPQVAGFTTEQLSRTHEDLTYILRFVEAAIVVDDPSVLHDFTDWTRDVLTARGLPGTTLPRTFAALDEVLDAQGLPRAVALLREQLEAAGADP